MFKAILAGLLLTAILPGHSQAQRDYSKVEIKPTKLAENVYVLEGSGGGHRCVDR